MGWLAPSFLLERGKESVVARASLGNRLITDKRASVATQSTTFSSNADSIFSVGTSHRSSVTTLNSSIFPYDGATFQEFPRSVESFQQQQPPPTSASQQGPPVFNTFFNLQTSSAPQLEITSQPDSQLQGPSPSDGSIPLDPSQQIYPVQPSSHSSPNVSLGSPSEIYHTPNSGMDIGTPEAASSLTPIKSAATIACPFAHLGCVKTYARPGHLENHLKQKHKDEEAMFCGGCRGVYKQSTWTFHPESCRQSADSSTAWGCRQCDLYFPSANALATHVSRDTRHTDNIIVPQAASDRSFQDVRSAQSEPSAGWSDISASPVTFEPVERQAEAPRPSLRITAVTQGSQTSLGYSGMSPDGITSGKVSHLEASTPTSATHDNTDSLASHSWPTSAPVQSISQPVVAEQGPTSNTDRSTSMVSMDKWINWESEFAPAVDTMVDDAPMSSPIDPTFNLPFQNPSYQLAPSTPDSSTMDMRPTTPTANNMGTPGLMVQDPVMATTPTSFPTARPPTSVPSTTPKNTMKPPRSAITMQQQHQQFQQIQLLSKKRKLTPSLGRSRHGHNHGRGHGHGVDSTSGHQVNTYNLPFVDSGTPSEHKLWDRLRKNVFAQSYPHFSAPEEMDMDARLHGATGGGGVPGGGAAATGATGMNNNNNNNNNTGGVAPGFGIGNGGMGINM